MAMSMAQQVLPNIPYIYKGIYFIFVCASVLLVFVYWPDIRHSWLKVQIAIKKTEPKDRTRSFDLVKSVWSWQVI
jgi:hypothetical protein